MIHFPPIILTVVSPPRSILSRGGRRRCGICPSLDSNQGFFFILLSHWLLNTLCWVSFNMSLSSLQSGWRRTSVSTRSLLNTAFDRITWSSCEVESDQNNDDCVSVATICRSERLTRLLLVFKVNTPVSPETWREGGLWILKLPPHSLLIASHCVLVEGPPHSAIPNQLPWSGNDL